MESYRCWMDGIPSLLSSAQTTITGGFARLDRAAAQFASLNSTPDTPSPATLAPTADPLLGGMVDLLSAREEVSAGVVLLDTSARMFDALSHVVDRYDPTNGASAPHAFDRYA